MKGFDVIHSQHGAGTVCAVLKKTLKRPWIVTFHGSWSSSQMAMMTDVLGVHDFFTYRIGFPVFHGVTHLELAFADMPVACSNTLAAELSADYGRASSEIRVIQNGVNTEFYDSIAKEYGQRQDKNPTLFFCGRLYQVKGILYLLEAIKIVRQYHPNLKLRIFGRGPLKDSILSYVQSSRLEKNVEVNGYVSAMDLAIALTQSDIVTLPSMYEAQSIAALEAMASSKPVVAFDMPFSREILRDGTTGLLARPRDTEDLARKILQLLDNDDLRRKIGLNAKYYVKANHNWKKIAQSYLRAYSDAREQLVRCS